MGKQLIYILVYCIFFACAVSCSSKKAITKTHEESIIDAKLDGNLTVLRSTETGEVSMSEILSHYKGIKTITFRVYDTDKEPDSLGNRPLLAEGEIREETNNEVISMNTSAVENIVKDSISSHIEEQVNKYDERDEYNYTKKEQPAWYSLAILVGVLMFVSFAYRIYKR